MLTGARRRAGKLCGHPASRRRTRAASASSALSADDTVAGVVAETMNSGGYTYARLSADGGDTWIAGTAFTLAVGDSVTAVVDLPMEQFHSRTLQRDFPRIYFVREVARNGATVVTAAAAAASPVAAATSGPAMMGSHAAGAPAAGAESTATATALLRPWRRLPAA